jgi:hypothetical protein
LGDKPRQESEPEKSSLEKLYSEAWNEYHHTEYMIFVYLAAAVAADVTLLQMRPSVISLVIAAVLGLTAILVTVRQIESRKYRMDIIERVEERLHLTLVVGKENPSAIRLGTTLLMLSILLFVIPVLWLFFTFFRHG